MINNNSKWQLSSSVRCLVTRGNFYTFSYVRGNIQHGVHGTILTF